MKKLATAGGAVQLRSVALNVAFIFITKKVQGLDATGTAAAAHAVTIQLWQLGGVILFALSTVASIIVPSELNRKGGGAVRARASANRLLSWLGLGVGVRVRANPNPNQGRRVGRRAGRTAARGHPLPE